MRDFKWMFICLSVVFVVIASVLAQSPQQNAPPKKPSSYMPVVDTETFAATHDRMSAAKSAVMKRQMDLLAERYDLSNKPAQGVVMDRSTPVQDGVRVKLPAGVTWTRLAGVTAQQIHDKDLFPQGFLPLPHANPSRRWNGLSEVRTPGAGEAGATRPHPIRSRLRHSGTLSSRISAGYLLNHAAGPGRCL